MPNKPKDIGVSFENPKKRDEYTPAIHQMKRGDGIPAVSLKKKDGNARGAHSTKRDQYTTNSHFTRRNGSVPPASQKKQDRDRTGSPLTRSNDRFTVPTQKTREQPAFAATPKKKDERAAAIDERKRDESPTLESPEEAGSRRKHHRLWTIAEVKKLIDGVAEHGVGRWSRIKKIYFPASAHRTSVDLKVKKPSLLPQLLSYQ